jgi:hypothetical protein
VCLNKCTVDAVAVGSAKKAIRDIERGKKKQKEANDGR